MGSYFAAPVPPQLTDDERRRRERANYCRAAVRDGCEHVRHIRMAALMPAGSVFSRSLWINGHLELRLVVSTLAAIQPGEAVLRLFDPLFVLYLESSEHTIQEQANELDNDVLDAIRWTLEVLLAADWAVRRYGIVVVSSTGAALNVAKRVMAQARVSFSLDANDQSTIHHHLRALSLPEGREGRKLTAWTRFSPTIVEPTANPVLLQQCYRALAAGANGPAIPLMEGATIRVERNGHLRLDRRLMHRLSAERPAELATIELWVSEHNRCRRVAPIV